MLCRKHLGDFFLKTKLADQVLEFDKGKDSKNSWQKVRDTLRQSHFEWVFCPHESLRSARLVWELSASHKVGFKKPWNFLVFKKRWPRPMHLPEALRQLSLLQGVDEEISLELNALIKNKSFNLSLMQGQEIPHWASMGLADQESQREKTIFLAPGSVWATKRWTEEGFVEVAIEMQKRGYQVTWVGAPDEKEICDRLQIQVEGSDNLAGKTSLYELYEAFKKGSALVANDSGAMHMASVAGLPTVAVFGPTILDFGYRPWNEKAEVVQKSLDCRPCGTHGAKRCPIGTHECMTSVSAREVVKYLERTLA